MEKKFDKWYGITSHVFAYRSKEMLFRTHAFNFNCFLGDFNCVFRQLRCLTVLLLYIIKVHKLSKLLLTLYNILPTNASRQDEFWAQAQKWFVTIS